MSLGAACYGCGTSTGAVPGKTSPTAFNKKSSAKYGWSVKTTSTKYKGVDDKTLALDIYCLQHAVETALGIPGCSGTCTPTVATGNCYNRDGMIGARTLQHLGNEISKGTTVGKWWAANLNIPSQYITVAKPPPASDVRPDVAAGTGTAGQVHADLIAGGNGVIVVNPTSSSSYIWWLLGIIAAGVGGYFLYQKYGKKTLKSFKASPRKQIKASKRKTTKRRLKRSA